MYFGYISVSNRDSFNCSKIDANLFRIWNMSQRVETYLSNTKLDIFLFLQVIS